MLVLDGADSSSYAPQFALLVTHVFSIEETAVANSAPKDRPTLNKSVNIRTLALAPEGIS